MLDLQNLLDQIQRLDQQATKGPWEAVTDDYSSEVAEYQGAHIPGVADEVTDYYIGTVPPLEPQDAEFIALARTALPQLAKALQAVMELHKPVELYPAVTPGVIYCYSCWDSVQDEALEYPCETYQTITDAMGADDD